MIKLNLIGNVFIFVALVVAFILLSIWIYRRTNPPVSGFIRRLLIALRILTLFIVTLILFEPLLTITLDRVQKPIIAVLLDTSASMNLKDARSHRAGDATNVLRQPVLQDKSKFR